MPSSNYHNDWALSIVVLTGPLWRQMNNFPPRNSYKREILDWIIIKCHFVQRKLRSEQSCFWGLLFLGRGANPFYGLSFGEKEFLKS
jgi:hypothetical protein